MVSSAALRWTPQGGVGSFADDVAEVASNLGRTPYAHQMDVIRTLTQYDRHGKFLTIEAAVEGPRQSIGKTGGIILPIVLWSALTDPNHYIWTAHLLDTSQKIFMELARPGVGLIDSVEWLRRRVREITFQNNSEGITFVNGSQLDFRARSGKRSRGLSAANVVFDEWLYGTGEMTGAALPVMATFSKTGNARAYYASSAPKKESRSLRQLRARALAKDPTLAYVGFWAKGSWSDPGCSVDECSHEKGIQGCALDDESLWMMANPTVPDVVSLAFLRTMRNTLEPVEFGREFLGWGEEGDGLAEPLAWSELADPESRPRPWPMAIGVDVGPRQKWACVVAAGRRADGLLHVEILAHGEGTRWLRDFLESKVDATGGTVFHLGGSAPVMSAATTWTNIHHVKISEGNYASGCGTLHEAVVGRSIRHLGDAILAKAVQSAVKRDVGDGSFVLSRSMSGASDITPAVAMAVALYGLESLPADDVWGYAE